MARVTVIIPTFNRAAYLEESIASAASQDLDEARIVVCDNASEDDTPGVVERAMSEFGAERVQYVRRPENLGWRDNFNLALADVQTEYAIVLGDDDRLLPGALKRAVEALDRHPTAGFVHASFETIDSWGEPVETSDSWTGLTEDTLEPGQLFISRSMPWPTRVFVHGTVIRHAAFQDPMWDPDDGLVADCILWLRIALDWDVHYLTTPAAQRRVHSGALSTGFGQLAGVDYVFDADAVLTLRAAKFRFIERFADRLEDPGALRRGAYQGSRRELAAYCRALSGPSRRRGMHTINQVVRAQKSVFIEPSFWRGIAKVLLGPRVSALLSTGGSVPASR